MHVSKTNMFALATWAMLAAGCTGLAEPTVENQAAIEAPTQCSLMHAWETVSTSPAGQMTADEGRAVQAWYELWNASVLSEDVRTAMAAAQSEIDALGVTYETLEARYSELSVVATPAWSDLETQVEILFATLPDDGTCDTSADHATVTSIAGPRAAPRRFSVRGGGFLLWLPGVLLCTSSYHEERDAARATCQRESFPWEPSCSEAHDVVNAAVCASTFGVYYQYAFDDYLGCCLGSPPET